MENLAHSLTGLLLARTGLKSQLPFGTAAIIVAANLPDIDAVAGFGGPLYYLEFHRGITHSIAGILIQGVLFSLLLWALRPRDCPFKFSKTLGVVYLALATHPLLDLSNSYGLRPFLPFDDLRLFGDILFIVDPYLWLILGSAAFLTATRSPVTRVIWVIAVILLLAIAIWFSRFNPAGQGVLGLLFITIVILWFLKRKRRVWPPTTAAAGLAVMGSYCLILMSIHQWVNHRASDQVAESYSDLAAIRLSVLPRAADPLNWDLFLENGEAIYYDRYSLVKRNDLHFQRLAKNLDQAPVQAALKTCPGAVVSRFGRFEFFEVELEEKGPVVVFKDARYALERDSGFGVFRIPMAPGLEEDRVESPCPE